MEWSASLKSISWACGIPCHKMSEAKMDFFFKKKGGLSKSKKEDPWRHLLKPSMKSSTDGLPYSPAWGLPTVVKQDSGLDVEPDPAGGLLRLLDSWNQKVAFIHPGFDGLSPHIQKSGLEIRHLIHACNGGTLKHKKSPAAWGQRGHIYPAFCISQCPLDAPGCTHNKIPRPHLIIIY